MARAKKANTITDNYVFLTSQDDNSVGSYSHHQNHNNKMEATVVVDVTVHSPIEVEAIVVVFVVKVEAKVVTANQNINSGHHFCHNNNNIGYFNHGIQCGNLGPHGCFNTQ